MHCVYILTISKTFLMNQKQGKGNQQRVNTWKFKINTNKYTIFVMLLLINSLSNAGRCDGQHYFF